MKLRNGFVSNSSSSSFLVVLDELPKSATEVKQLLFGDVKFWKKYDYTVRTEDIADVLWSDIQAQLDKLPYSLDVIADAMESNVYSEMYYVRIPLFIPGMPADLMGELHSSHQIRKHWYEFDKDHQEAEREAQEAELQERKEKAAQKFLEDNKGKVILQFEYGDHDGEVSTVMEHGDIFQKVRHIRISNH